MRRLLVALILAALVPALGGCAAPLHPYNVPDVDFRYAPMAPLPPPPQVQAVPRQAIVMCLWTNETTNPVGGLYDWTSYNVSPLYRTYYNPDVAVPMMEGTFDELRGTGYRTYKDYSDVGNPALVKGPARQLGAVLLTGRVLRAVHDQIREDDAPGSYEAGFVEVDFVLVTLAGEVLWRGTKIARLKVPYDFGQDLLDGLGRSLGAQLHADPGFTAALAAAAQKRAEVRP